MERSIGWINNRFLGRNTLSQWAPEGIVKRWDLVDHYHLLANDATYVQSQAEGMGGSTPQYISIPLAQRINRTSANLLFGETPRITVESDADKERLGQLINLNRLYSKLKRAAEETSCTGGIYGLAYVDTRTPRGQQGALLRFISERRAIPVFKNDDELISVEFLSEFSEGSTDMSSEVWRLIEKHEPGMISNRLYHGSRTELGKEVSLESIPQTKDLSPEIETGLDMLDVVYIPNHLGAQSALGISDLAGIEPLLLAVNEAATLASDDARAAAATIFARQDLLSEDGNLAEGTKIIPVTLEEGGDDQAPFLQTVQPNLRSEQFASFQDFLVDMTLQAAGFAPQSLGRNVSGGAESGTARKLMMHHTLVEHAGKALLWEDSLRHLLDVARQLDAQAYDGKPAASWSDLEGPITVSLADGMPEDLRELSVAIRDLRSAGTISVEEAVRLRMGDAEEDAIQAEIDRLQAEQGAVVSQAAQEATQNGPDTAAILADLGF